MSTNGKLDQQNNAPSFQVDDKGNYGQDQYGNNVFAADATETAVTNAITHQGWVKRIAGKGQVLSIAVSAGGTGYANGEVVSITADEGANTEGTITTDGSGVIESVEITEQGGYFTSTSPTVNITTTAGTGATLTASVGGRAGRISYETLATAHISSDGSDDSTLPDA